MKKQITFHFEGQDITGTLEIFSSQWVFNSGNVIFKRHFPYGLSSFMQYAETTAAKKQIIDIVISEADLPF